MYAGEAKRGSIFLPAVYTEKRLGKNISSSDRAIPWRVSGPWGGSNSFSALTKGENEDYLSVGGGSQVGLLSRLGKCKA